MRWYILSCSLQKVERSIGVISMGDGATQFKRMHNQSEKRHGEASGATPCAAGVPCVHTDPVPRARRHLQAY